MLVGEVVGQFVLGDLVAPSKGNQTTVISALAKAVSWFLFSVHGWGETKIEKRKIEKDDLLATGDSARQSKAGGRVLTSVRCDLV